MSLDRELLYEVDGSDEFIDEEHFRKFVPKPAPIEVGWTWRLAIACFATSLGAGLPAGFCLGVVNTPSAIIKQWCNDTMIARYNVHLTASGITLLWSTAVSILLIGGMIGSLSGAVIANKIGRRGAMILGEFGFVVAAALFFVAKPIRSLECLFAGRLTAGLCSGLITAVMPMYLTEMAPMTLQGTVGAMCPLALTFGVFFAQVMGLDSVLGIFLLDRHLHGRWSFENERTTGQLGSQFDELHRLCNHGAHHQP